MAAPLRIAFLSLSIDLYQKAIPHIIPAYEEFHKILKQALMEQGTVVADRLCYGRAEIEHFIHDAESQHGEVLVVAFQSYHPSLTVLPALLSTKLPLLIWNTQRLAQVGADFGMQQLLENHGMHGVQDLCNALLRNGRRFGLLSGHHAAAGMRGELAAWLKACQAVTLSRKLRVGRLGPVFQGMGDFGVDETRMLGLWGPAVEQLSLKDLAACLQEVTEDQLQAAIDRDQALFEIMPDITQEDHRRSARMSIALQALVEAPDLHAFTQHFGIYGEYGDASIETCPFLGINHLIASGMGYAGEGNVTIAALDALLSRMFGQSNFCEMFTADYQNNEILFYHMAEGNYAMASHETRPRLKKVPYDFGTGQPYLTPVYAYEPGASTFVNLTTDPDGKFYLLAFEATLTDYSRLTELNAPHFKARFAAPLDKFLNSYSLLGGTHHLCRVAGNQLTHLEKLAHMLEIELKLV